MTRLENLAKEKPEIRKLLDALVELSTEHNGCCWEIGDLYNRIQEKFRRSGPAGLTDKDLETETSCLKAQSTKDSSICYRMGTKYNELCQLLSQDQAEVLGTSRSGLVQPNVAAAKRVGGGTGGEARVQAGKSRAAESRG